VFRPRKRARTGSGGAHGQGVQLAHAGGGRLDRGAAGGEQDVQRAALGPGAGLCQLGAGQRVAGGADRVDRVGLRPRFAGGAGRAVQLDDQLLAVGQVAGQTGAVAAGALDRPGAQPGVPFGQLHQFGVAVRVGGHGGLVEHGSGPGGEHRGGVGVGMGVDADDDVDQFCQHGHGVLLTTDGRGSGPDRSRAGL
jgi:hypothetical protein